MAERYSQCLIHFTLVVLVVIGCRKNDTVNEKTTVPVSPGFYSVSPGTHPSIAAIAASLKRQDIAGAFQTQLVDHAGLPKWDKAMVASKQWPRAKRGGEGEHDSVAVLLIPFVEDGANQTNALLRVQVVGADTSYELIYAGQYAEFGFDNKPGGEWNAGDLFHLFTKFDKAIFGHTKFRVSDERILGDTIDAEEEAIVVELQENKTASRYIIDTYCDSYAGCTVKCPPAGTMTPLRAAVEQSLSLQECCLLYGLYTKCTALVVETPSGSGGGSSNPANPPYTGGGIVGVPGVGPVQDPCAGKLAGRLIAPNAVPGDNPKCYEEIPWEPVGMPPAPDPIDSLSKTTSELVNKYRDSLAALCEAEHKERFFNVVNYNNRLDTFRVLIGLSDDELKPNYYMAGGRTLKGSWHYNPKYSDGTPGSWPSGGDVVQLFDKPEGFVMIIDTYNARYALVVEDVNKMIAWMKKMGNGPNTFPKTVRDAVAGDPRFWAGANDYIQMTREKLLTALGTSNNCGIGLYEASSSNGTTFTKQN